MGKKMFAMLIVAVVAMFAGYNVYQSQNTVVLSELALANVEALAEGEGDTSGGRCVPSWNRECCICEGLHRTFTHPNWGGGCEHGTNCRHWQ